MDGRGNNYLLFSIKILIEPSQSKQNQSPRTLLSPKKEVIAGVKKGLLFFK